MFKKARKLRRIAISLIIALFVLGLLVFAFTVNPARAQSRETIVINPDGSISSPVTANITTTDNVTYTFTGNNYLPIVVNRSNIVIDGMGFMLRTSNGIGFSLMGMNNVTVKSATVKNSYYGVYLDFSSNSVLSSNNVANSCEGIYLDFSDNNTLFGNNVTASSSDGIMLEHCSNNLLSENSIKANDNGILLQYSSGNRIIHNDFFNNTQQAAVSSSNDTWDNGYPSGGNYWRNYQTRYPAATQIDDSGIWNTPYVIASNNTDRYPLVGSFHTFSVGIWNGVAYNVTMVSNSTITNLTFNPAATPYPTLSFSVSGANATTGFCRVTIPKSLMSCDNNGQWMVTVNGTLPIYLNVTSDASYTYIYFTYHHSTEQVNIMSLYATPELQPFMLLPLFMIMTLFGVTILRGKRRAKK
jgi:parallel beta-helix repeat protein